MHDYTDNPLTNAEFKCHLFCFESKGRQDRFGFFGSLDFESMEVRTTCGKAVITIGHVWVGLVDQYERIRKFAIDRSRFYA